MANRRQIKKDINELLADVIDECYESLYRNKGQNQKEVEAIIDEVVEVADSLIGKINAAQKLTTRSEVKKCYAEVKEELSEMTINFIEKLNLL